MAIDWTPEQAQRVAKLMELHPLEGGCAALGRALLPVARQRDARAGGLVIRAKAGQVRYPCLEPYGWPMFWFHHVTVGIQEHGVDALTGVPGTELAFYFVHHFANDPDEVEWDDKDPNLEDPSL